MKLGAGYGTSLDPSTRSLPISDRFFFDNATFVSKLVRGYPKATLGPADAGGVGDHELNAEHIYFQSLF